MSDGSQADHQNVEQEKQNTESILSRREKQ